jgi:shikimate kinase
MDKAPCTKKRPAINNVNPDSLIFFVHCCSVTPQSLARMKRPILLIGHRTSGKTTLGRLLATDLACTFFDLDDEIEQRTGKSAAEWVSSDEAAFRALEEETLASLTTTASRSVIAAGGGLRGIPADLYVIWIHREGWENDALATRVRLKPEFSPEEEISWMKAARDEHYRRSAHVQLNIERGCTIAQAATRLRLLADWLLAASSSPIMRMSWMRPRDRDDLQRCVAQARLFDMAGVEIRSDMFDELPEVPVPVLASLRSPDPAFFSRATRAVMFDCDTAFIQHLDLRGIEARPLIFSTHPDDVYKEFFEYLTSLPDFIATSYPAWSEQLMLKYAPRVKSWVELRYANQLYKVFEKAGKKINFFPQGKRWNWMRVQRLFAGNQFNFISSGCLERSQLPPGMDYFLPHCAATAPISFYGVIGGQVDGSVGDIFHSACAASLSDDSGVYVKIPLAPAEIDNCLHLLPQIGFKGLSVTSPLKRAVYDSNFVGCETDLKAGNTLALIKGSFLLFDTDETGMTAALEEIEKSGIRSGTAMVFGEGGVSEAICRALAGRGWHSVQTTSARRGWEGIDTQHFTLIVNASGQNASSGAPPCDAWLDVRYRDIDAPPATAAAFFNGMTMYKHQAAAQRRIWQLHTNDELLRSL